MTLRECNERLSALRERMARGRKTEAVLQDLYAQRDEAEKRSDELARELASEQADLDRLTGGFWSVYYAVVGKKRDMLEKERADVMKASMKYETTRNELKRILDEIDRLEWERQDVKNCEREYERVLSEKLLIMKENGLKAEELTGLEERKRELRGQIREVGEALNAGRKVMAEIDRIRGNLNRADGYATWDLLGGGLIADAAKHSYLDEAQRGAAQLQRLLSAFRTELADLSVYADVHAQVGGFTRFADFFFDGFFADIAVKDHIGNAQEEIGRTERQMNRRMEQLRRLEREMKRQMDKLDGEMRALAEWEEG